MNNVGSRRRKGPQMFMKYAGMTMEERDPLVAEWANTIASKKSQPPQRQKPNNTRQPTNKRFLAPYSYALESTLRQRGRLRNSPEK